MIKAVIFDMDDTLISEKQYIESGYRHIAKIISLKLNEKEKDIYIQLLKLLSINSENVFNRLFDELGVVYNKGDIVKLVKEYRNHTPNIILFKDVLPILEVLKSKKIKTGIITDGYSVAQRKKLKVIDAEMYFDKIIVTDELGREFWKPHPYSFEKMKDEFNIDFHEMMYVGDNPEKDFHIGSDYPVKTVRIIRKNSVHQNKPYLNGICEDYSISSLVDLSEYIE